MPWFLILLLALGAALIYAKLSYKPNIHETSFKKEFDNFKLKYAANLKEEPDLMDVVEGVEVKALVFCAQKPLAFPENVDYRQRTYDLVLTYLISKIVSSRSPQKVAKLFTTDKSNKYIQFYNFLMEDARQNNIITEEQYQRGLATLKTTLTSGPAAKE